MQATLSISSQRISLDDIFVYFNSDFSIALSEECISAVAACRAFLLEKLKDPDVLIYGINTGFGSMCNTKISKEEVSQLQYNLVVSHACGVGEVVPEDIARLILLLKIKNLSFGYSGVRYKLLQKMVDMYNAGLTPVLFTQGSLGASGDLAPLAHLSLPLLGLGEVWKNGIRLSSSEAMYAAGIEPLKLQAKEGLALLNGTQFSLGYAIWAAYHAKKIIEHAVDIAAMSMEAFACSPDPISPEIHRIRNHKGQIYIAGRLRDALEGSKLISNAQYSVQDPYSFRCTPQVLGASFDALAYTSGIAEDELNAVTDNPNIFPKEEIIISGGNFHGQPLALTMDFLAIALSEIANISERRTFQLLSGQRELPFYLTDEPGLNSGLMIAQYTAASVVSQTKQLCTPASVDSIVSSAGQEDHVSMSANAGTKLFRVVNNIYKVLAIELMTACQALEYRDLQSAAPQTRKLYSAFRQKVEKLTEDRILSSDIRTAVHYLKH